MMKNFLGNVYDHATFRNTKEATIHNYNRWNCPIINLVEFGEISDLDQFQIQIEFSSFSYDTNQLRGLKGPGRGCTYSDWTTSKSAILFFVFRLTHFVFAYPNLHLRSPRSGARLFYIVTLSEQTIPEYRNRLRRRGVGFFLNPDLVCLMTASLKNCDTKTLNGGKKLYDSGVSKRVYREIFR